MAVRVVMPLTRSPFQGGSGDLYAEEDVEMEEEFEEEEA